MPCLSLSLTLLLNAYAGLQSFRLQQLGQHTRWSSNSLAIHLVCRDEAIRLTSSHAFQIVNLVMEPSQIQSNKAKIRETLWLWKYIPSCGQVLQLFSSSLHSHGCLLVFVASGSIPVYLSVQVRICLTSLARFNPNGRMPVYCYQQLKQLRTNVGIRVIRYMRRLSRASGYVYTTSSPGPSAWEASYAEGPGDEVDVYTYRIAFLPSSTLVK